MVLKYFAANCETQLSRSAPEPNSRRVQGYFPPVPMQEKNVDSSIGSFQQKGLVPTQAVGDPSSSISPVPPAIHPP